MISDLPAVQEATSEHGVFTYVVNTSLSNPNLSIAKRILRDGTFPVDKVPFLADAQLMGRARQKVGPFEQLVVVPADIPTLTFGGFLILGEEVTDSPYLEMVLAHEAGHVVNGDAYVKAALWFLGKSIFGEKMTPYHIPQQDPNRETLSREVSFIFGQFGRSNKAGIISLLAMGGMYFMQNRGNGVKHQEARIIDFFQRWDVEADKFAERLKGEEYRYYLTKLDTVRTPFEASPKTRIEGEVQVVDTTPAPKPVGNRISKILLFAILLLMVPGFMCTIATVLAVLLS